MNKLIRLKYLCELNKPHALLKSTSATTAALNQQFIIGRKFFCTTNDKQTESVERKIEPVTLSYNSYETTPTASAASAPPIIIMHGLFGSKQNWRSICKSLNAKSSPTRKVYAVDARNHGESPHSPNHGYEDLAEDVRLFYDTHNIDKAIVLGHSMGGRTMMTFALKYPELVEKAIIVDVSPVTTSPAMKNMAEVFAAMNSVRVEKGLSPSDGRESANEQLKTIITNKVTRDFILMNLFRADDGSFKWRANVSALHTNFTKYIARFPENLSNRQYRLPTLFIGGTESDYLTYRWCVNVDVFEKHRKFLIHLPEHLKRDGKFKGPILFLGGSRSTQLDVSQIPEITRNFPLAELRILEGGHNIGISYSRDEFLEEAAEFINRKSF